MISLSQIGNADQTPLAFNLSSPTTKGAKQVTTKTTGNKNNIDLRRGWHATQTVINYHHLSFLKEEKNMPKLTFPKGVISSNPRKRLV